MINMQTLYLDSDKLDENAVGDVTLKTLVEREQEFVDSLRNYDDVSEMHDALEAASLGGTLSVEQATQYAATMQKHLGQSYGLEDYSGSMPVLYAGMALEGFTDVIKTLWAKVRDGFRKLIAFIMDCFKRITSNLNRVYKAAEKVIKVTTAKRKDAPPNGRKCKVLKNKYLYVNGQYDVKGPDRVTGLLLKMNESIPDNLGNLVVRVANMVTRNREASDFDKLVTDFTKAETDAMKFAKNSVSDSDNPFKRPGTKCQRTDLIAANKALYVITADSKGANAIEIMKNFTKKFDMHLHVVKDMNKPIKGVETKVRPPNILIGDMRGVMTAIETYQKAETNISNIRKNMDRAIQSTNNIADNESMDKDRRMSIRAAMDSLMACRKLMGSNIVGTYALCASTLKAHVKQAREELKHYQS